METAVALVQCPDTKGIVAAISGFILELDANMVQADQYSAGGESPTFFMRVEFCFDEDTLSHEELEKGFAVLAEKLNATYEIHYLHRKMRMGVLVSKFDHCLADILYRHQSAEFDVDIPFVASNHADLRDMVEAHRVPFYHIPVRAGAKAEAEAELLAMAAEQTDFLVLARYMQILSSNFLDKYGKDVINIHHSFLPSFKGADPYRQAYEKGVKIIGATAHYVTADLDEGPIIEQVVSRVSHTDNVDALKRKGRNLEKIALSNALHSYIEHKIIRHKNKTIVFS